MQNNPKPFEIYRHFKGNFYQVISIAEHSETAEKMVVYQALYGDYKLYVRPYDMFVGKVEKDKYPEIKQEYRFELQEKVLAPQPLDSQSLVAKAVDSKPSAPQPAPQPSSQPSSQPAPRPLSQPASQPLVSQSLDFQPSDLKSSVKPVDNADEFKLAPILQEFLDADTYEERLNILVFYHNQITQDIINTIAASLDIEVKDGELEDRYEEVKNCLITFEKFECNRLR